MGYRLKVKEIAKQKGVSQRRLFFLSEVDLGTIQKIFRDPTSANITMQTLDKLSTALEVDISLLIESDPMLPKTIE